MRDATTSVCASGPILTLHSRPDASVTLYVVLNPDTSLRTTSNRASATGRSFTGTPSGPLRRLRGVASGSTHSSAIDALADVSPRFACRSGWAGDDALARTTAVQNRQIVVVIDCIPRDRQQGYCQPRSPFSQRERWRAPCYLPFLVSSARIPI